MKIDRVILSTNANPAYSDFWPIVAKAWQKWGIKPTLAFICDRKIKLDETLGDVIKFEPIQEIPISIQTQTIRLLIPCLFKNDVCIISDIDVLPISKKYFINSIVDVPNDKFVIYNDTHTSCDILISPMCFNAAQGKIFQEIFKINNKEEIPKTIKYWWNELTLKKLPLLSSIFAKDKIKFETISFLKSTDERMLALHLQKWPEFSRNTVNLGYHHDRIIDKNCWKYDTKLLKDEFYTWAHLPLPYKNHKKLNDQLLIDLGWTDLIPS